ncbi:NEL-type E3 ubiquitin ligase domain-containing protein [Pseudomonas sp. P1.8]|uniref:NEL-type E3 ubiquitin ligase domain-containing protein n=1 Tax=Pseudomonas sp. P1.8 TaxID=1699310 RepID=UPI0009EB2F3D|nr:NEL-type E3 ubiquitin ligase domain-containing protein [Pseudomonas sp. P1.8]
MLPAAPTTPPVVPLTSTQRLESLLEHTGDLDTAQTLQESMPEWLTSAELSVAQALNSAMQQSQVSYTKAAEVLARLKPLDEYCKEQLTLLLKEKWKVDVDVERDTLDIIKAVLSSTGVLPVAWEKGKVTRSRSLLHAAMENFTSEEATPGGLPKDSVIKVDAKPQKGADMTPAKFAELCRELDLGGKYQSHVNDVLALPANPTGNPVSTASSAADIRQLKLLDIQVAAHVAYLKKHISSTVYTMLLSVIEQDLPAAKAKGTLFDGAPVIWQGLQIHDACLCGVLVFTKVSIDTAPSAKCVVYMPNEPRRPLYEYASLDDFKAYLTLHLQSKVYKDRFCELYFPGNDKTVFFTRFDKNKNLGSLTAMPADTCPGDFFFNAFVHKTQLDAQILAVPTAEVDELQREKTLQTLLDGGLLLLNAASFFVPVIGQLMLSVAVVEILSEVYEGVEDWAHGERTEALTHLLNVVESLAQMAVFAAGQKVVSSIASKVTRANPDFFKSFIPIEKTDGTTRLWKSDLKPYERRLSADKGLKADAEGFYEFDHQKYVQIDGHFYAVDFDAAAEAWKIKHPTRQDAYTPILEHNGQGGWRQPGERTEEWSDGAYVLKRLDSRLAAQDNSRLEKIRQVTASPLSELHRLSEENLQLPARLQDSIDRFRLEQRVRDCIAILEQGDPEIFIHTDEQMNELPSMKGWPTGRYIRVLNDEGITKKYFPKDAFIANEEPAVDVTEEQLSEGQLLRRIVSGLYPKEVEDLLGGTVSDQTENDALAKKLAASMKNDRLPLFERLYEAHDTGNDSDAELLRKAFPKVPHTIARELIDQISSVERLRLRTLKRVPMRLAQRAREALAEVKLDRGIGGLHLPEIADVDTRNLAFSLLEHLPGWNSELLLELRNGSITGPVLRSIGKQGSALKRTIVESAEGYRVFDGDDKNLASVLQGPEALYQAIAHALPESQLTTMSLGANRPAQVLALRNRLASRAVEDRARSARLLTGKPPGERVAPDTCVLADPPAASSHASGLVRKAKKLYPLKTEAQISTLLDSLGTDHLSRATAVQQRQGQLEKLRRALKSWRNDDTEMRKLQGDLNEYRQSRRQVSDAIENAWRQMGVVRDEQRASSVLGLRLDGMRVGQLPTLSPDIDFDHIELLSLKNMNQGNDLAYFLKHFKSVQSLELDSNQLTLLPESISLMTGLRYLSLADNKLVMTEQTLKKLAAMRTLKTLNLSKNPLGTLPDVGKMFDLRLLMLRNTRATELPKGLAKLPNLDRVDLRDNDIGTLPDWLFTVPRRFSQSINLRTNPLVNDSRVKLKAYRDRVGIGMGFLEDDIARLDEQTAKALWLPEEVNVTYSPRGKIWTAFKDDPGSDGLFRLLAELGNTADSQYVREDMTRRVWSVLEAAEGNAALREQVFDLAANPINCTDSAAFNFSNLEVAVEIEKITGPLGSAQSAAASLTKLGKGLFRLDQLDKITQTHISRHPEVDPLEVGLAYRTGLIKDLDLPGQPQHMRYKSLSGVSEQDLASAKTSVQRAEHSPELSKFLVQRPFWIDYLKRSFAEDFAKMTEPLQDRLQKVFDQRDTMTDADYRTQIDTIKTEQATAEKTLLERLTGDVLKLVDTSSCAIPER